MQTYQDAMYADGKDITFYLDDATNGNKEVITTSDLYSIDSYKFSFKNANDAIILAVELKYVW